MTQEEINSMKYIVCCPLCDIHNCIKNTDECEAEKWAKDKEREELQ